MKLDKIKPGINVIIAKKSSPHYLKEARVLSTISDITGDELIRLLIEDSGEVVTGYLAADLEP